MNYFGPKIVSYEKLLKIYYTHKIKELTYILLGYLFVVKKEARGV